MEKVYGAVEAGGTKTLVAVGRTGKPFLRMKRVPTGDPEETLGLVSDFFRAAALEGLGIQALGIGTFGPVELDRQSPDWGFVTSTPKLRWRGTDFAGALGRALGVPVGFDTDVNAAVLAEAKLGAGLGLDPVLYLTIGTGIGGGIFVNGSLLHGNQHPEMGHLRLARRSGDDYPGFCPFHADCWEGLASGPAIEARWGARGETLPPDHPAWDLEAWYVAQGVVSLIMILSPRVVILGGGIMSTPGILERVRGYAKTLCADYLVRPKDEADWERVIQAPKLEIPGLSGALLLAEAAGSAN